MENADQFDQYACDVIDAIGGTAATARLCEIQQPSVSEWKKTGIPKARLQFLRLARPDAFVKADNQEAA
ncbi:hypothetical protein [Burkholderia gladioli]|uniref:hypothetical protein n=1 Tax=Burkholderia gladioli TaxID=28095 RepID=UPI00163F5144|nr:hypothetical protein [Burkholderia gladioli]